MRRRWRRWRCVVEVEDEVEDEVEVCGGGGG